MKIAFLGLRAIGDCTGGIERHVRELSIRMASWGHDVTVFCRSKYNDCECEVFEGVRLVNRPAIYSKHLEAITNTVACLADVAQEFDIVHFHATGPSLLSWMPRFFGRKVVVTVHGLDFQRAKWGFAAKCFLRAGAWTACHCPDETIVVSEPLQRYYRATYGRETTYIPNGVNEPNHRRIENLARFGIKNDQYILFLGRLVPEKGAHYLIEAFKTIPTNKALLIAGDACHMDGYAEYLRTLAGNDERIIFTGPLYGEEKDEAFSNAACFVLPSDLEGMPIVFLEALSYATPVLASNIDACTSVITAHGGDTLAPCRFFEASNTMSLAQTLSDILDDNERRSMGERGQNFALNTFNWETITRQTLSVYEGTLRIAS
ncbi:glycosyltransferase family 4 protein [Desulfovibrio inopinatus]|uniref:glycosyltransferase family 4 protein n=1 Tax=Desulfovibrio inopinatus TaxID=102109 RepID=UPI00041EC8E8|nr:glycosyltransferase family 4 protein [Desulfovibrio inopinatus]